MDLVTATEARSILGGTKPIPHSTLAHWRKVGIGPEYMKVGRTLRYPVEGLLRFLEQQTIGRGE